MMCIRKTCREQGDPSTPKDWWCDECLVELVAERKADAAMVYEARCQAEMAEAASGFEMPKEEEDK